jgi:UDP-N-acetylglucosamine 2-epimerase (non-hydrolysing)
MKNSQFIMTDSGGIQEEATAPSINKRVFVLRLSTERPEAVASGHASVVGTDPERVLPAIDSYVLDGCKPPVPSFPFGKGNAAQKTVETLVAEMEALSNKSKDWQ